jgi:DNA-binding XRE family transcriptional regulator
MTAVRVGECSPPVARRRVARQVRAMREQARLTLDEAAPRLDMSRSALHRVETGVTHVTVHLARSMMDLYDQYLPDLLDTIRAARQRGWWQSYRAADLEFVAWEAGASGVCEWAVVRLPALLQTDDYASALLRGSDRPFDELAVRRMRQRRLVAENPVAFTAVIDESALRNQVGGPEVMRAQLGHLVVCAARQAVTIHVLPASAGAEIRAPGFQILAFAHPDDPPVMYAEVPGGSIRKDEAASVAAARAIFDMMQTSALSCEDSQTFITRLAE